jgi:uncharacterized DUF497 family protein
MMYIVVPEVLSDFEWDQTKSDRNRLERDLPFDVAMAMFDGPTLEQPDLRRDYGEVRMRAIGKACGLILHCVYTDRKDARRIISLRPADRRERDDYRKAFQN